MDEALRFIAAFPDALAFHACYCSVKREAVPDKQDQHRRSAASPKAEAVARPEACAHFIRLLLGTSIFVDLDAYKKDWDVLVSLRPRALVQTSPGTTKLGSPCCRMWHPGRRRGRQKSSRVRWAQMRAVAT